MRKKSMVKQKRKRIIGIVLGVVISTSSIACLNHTSDAYGPFFAIAFSLGLFVTLQSIKRSLFDFAKNASSEHSEC